MKRRFFAFTLALLEIGCGGAVPASKFGELEKNAAPASPLGASFVLIAQPTDDTAMLGKIVKATPDDAHPIGDLLDTNPCADKLAEPKTSPTLNSFEDAREIGVGASANATLFAFGFQADATHATHILYKIETSKRVARQETPEYLSCCKERGCGVGYVSTIIFGNGEYSSAAETDLSGKIDVAIASSGGATALKTLHKRTVQGYLAVVVTNNIVADAPAPAAPPPAPPPAPSPLGPAPPEVLKAQYEAQRISICTHPDDRGISGLASWSYCDARGGMTENDFVRRYKATTGFHELDASDRDRGAFYRNMSFIYLGVGVAGLTVGIVTDGGASLAGYIGGGISLGMGAIFLPVWLAFRSGPIHNGADNSGSDSADLTEHDARLAVGRYNRALAHNLATGGATPVNRPSSSLRIWPTFGGRTIGIAGSFE